MKAAVYEGHGLSGIMVREVEKPLPGGGEVLVKVHAVALNAADYRSIKMGIIRKQQIIGADISGVVESVGRGVQGIKPGDEVVGDLSIAFGGLAEYAVAPAHALVHKPEGLPHGEAAALPMAGLTALQALREVEAGQKVLIVGAGGGVGNYAVQLAKVFGAYVTAVCGAANVALVRTLGADRVIDYTRESFTKGKERYDRILAVNGNYPISAYRRALAPGGACAIVGGALRQIVKVLVFGRLWSSGGKKVYVLSAKSSPEDLSLLVGLAGASRIRPVIDRRYPIDAAAEAMRYLAGGHARGKVVVDVVNPRT